MAMIAERRLKGGGAKGLLVVAQDQAIRTNWIKNKIDKNQVGSQNQKKKRLLVYS